MDVRLEKVSDYIWRVPREGEMLVSGIVFASERMLGAIKGDESLAQVANVATLPGIQVASYAMPDIHWGYGFPIGGVAAFDVDEGVVSPGGVGYDISCGVRLIKTGLLYEDIKERVSDLMHALFRNVPTGVGSSRRDFRLSESDEKKVLELGARWAVERGFGDASDLLRIEDGGTFEGADPSYVSKRALERGMEQLGTLGSGNHFLEVGFVDEVYDKEAADDLGLFEREVTIFIHTGSRGLGHQVCTDYIPKMLEASKRYGIRLRDKQLACAPINSKEGRSYLAAMAAAANFAMANRQMISHFAIETMLKFLSISPRALGAALVYDVSHNTAKFEEYEIGGVKKRVLVHRKGATRAFPGQPVLIPGDMGRYSYVLVGTAESLVRSFGSTCHGAGRLMSRGEAKRSARSQDVISELERKGIVAIGASMATIVEEMPSAYKDVTHVVDVCSKIGISKKVARIRPLGVIKG